MLKERTSVQTSLVLLCALVVLVGCESNKSVDYTRTVVDHDFASRQVYVHCLAKADSQIVIEWDSRADTAIVYPLETGGPVFRVSPDGKYFYFSKSVEAGSSILKFEKAQQALVGEFRPSSRTRTEIAVSRDGSLLACANYYVDRPFMFLDAETMQPLLSDTGFWLKAGTFSTSGDHFIAAATDRHVSFVMVFDIPSFSYRKKTVEGTRPWRVVPSHDGSIWYIYSQYGAFGGVQVYDTLRDTVIYELYFQGGYGDLSLSPDDRFLAFCSPDNADLDAIHQDSVFILDLHDNFRLYALSTFDMGRESDSVRIFPVKDVAFSPDGRYVFASGIKDRLFGEYYKGFVKVDLATMTARYIPWPYPVVGLASAAE